jgi:hypothetical protein
MPTTSAGAATPPGAQPQAAPQGARPKATARPSIPPAAWCRRVLTSLSQQETSSPVTGHVEMLLTYYIQVEPAAADFDASLERYVHDQRPRIAEAAALLQSAWRRTSIANPDKLP